MDQRYRNINDALPELAGFVMEHGLEVGSRLGERTQEVLNAEVTLMESWNREVVLPGRKAMLPAQIAETMWVLAGRDDIEWLSHYLPRAADFSDDGEVWRGAYGKRLRRWPNGNNEVDQLAHVVQLLKEERNTRRAVMSIYDPAVDTQPGKDIPCNNWLSFQSRFGYLHLHVAIRSNDLIWGWSGINAFEWSTLLEIVADLVGVRVGNLHFSISSLHVYDRHWDKATKLAGLRGMSVPTFAAGSPRFALSEFGTPATVADLDELISQWFAIEERLRAGEASAEVLSLVDNFPEPMFKGWLAALGWWWSGDDAFRAPIRNTPLEHALLESPKRKAQEEDAPTAVEADATRKAFVEYLADLHEQKNAVYGDSWRRRGEMLGILANLARKIDRLGVAGAGDTAADTAVDLAIYLAKYRVWAGDEPEYGMAAEDPAVIAMILGEVDSRVLATSDLTETELVEVLTASFANLETIVTRLHQARASATPESDHQAEWDLEAKRRQCTESMLTGAFVLAEKLWVAEQP